MFSRILRSTPFVGRSEELAEIARAFEDDEGDRVLTLVGAIGVGKSRLARAAATKLEERGAIARVVFVDASAATTLDALDDALAHALDVAPDGKDALAQALDAMENALVVVDDLDRIDGDRIDGGADPIARWRVAAPGCRFLITRRARPFWATKTLRIAPLATPAGDDFSGPAAELLRRCIARTRPSFAPTAAELPFLSELLRALDGLPLAIELAAPRLEIMNAAALLHRMRTARARGSSPSDDGPLVAALDGAWQSLRPHERDAMTMLTTFAGSFTVDAAEEVLAPALAGPPALDVVALLESLHARSLLEAHRRDDEVRLFMLRTLRDFVMRNGDSAVRAAAVTRHARCFADRAERWRRDKSAGNRAAARALVAERENLLAVVESVLDGGPIDRRAAEPALRALVALFPSSNDAPAARHLAVLRPTLEATHDSGAEPSLVARAHLVAGAAYRRRGDRADATRTLTRALHIATTIGDEEIEAGALVELAQILEEAGESEQARRHVVEALRRFSRRALHAEEANALVVLAELARATGDVETAQSACERAVALFAEARDVDGTLRAKHELGRALLDLGRHDALGALVESTLEEVGDVAARERNRLVFQLLDAWSRHDRADLDGAASTYETIDDRARQLGLSEIESLVLGSKGALAMERRDRGRAHALFRAARDARGSVTFRSTAIFSSLGAVLDATIARALADDADRSIERDAVAASVRRLVDAPGAWTEVESALRRLAPRSFFARLALRALGPGARARIESSFPAGALVIGDGARWFRSPAGATVDLERRKPLARVLARLAEVRASQPGLVVARDELSRVGWPGERILADAAAHRVRVAISTLRKLGLADALLTRDDGYLLDPRCSMLRDG